MVHKPKITYSYNYPSKSLKSAINYIFLYTHCNMYVYNVYNKQYIQAYKYNVQKLYF
jgi:hypothetical protein